MKQYPLTVCCQRLGITLFTLRQWCEKANIDMEQQKSLADPRQKWLTEEQLQHLALTHGRLLDQPKADPEPIPINAYKLLMEQVAQIQAERASDRQELVQLRTDYDQEHQAHQAQHAELAAAQTQMEYVGDQAQEAYRTIDVMRENFEREVDQMRTAFDQELNQYRAELATLRTEQAHDRLELEQLRRDLGGEHQQYQALADTISKQWRTLAEMEAVLTTQRKEISQEIEERAGGIETDLAHSIRDLSQEIGDLQSHRTRATTQLADTSTKVGETFALIVTESQRINMIEQIIPVLAEQLKDEMAAGSDLAERIGRVSGRVSLLEETERSEALPEQVIKTLGTQSRETPPAPEKPKKLTAKEKRIATLPLLPEGWMPLYLFCEQHHLNTNETRDLAHRSLIRDQCLEEGRWNYVGTEVTEVLNAQAIHELYLILRTSDGFQACDHCPH
jgi:predicted  nucleic acid-binding Zn-ribbon protein